MLNIFQFGKILFISRSVPDTVLANTTLTICQLEADTKVLIVSEETLM
jgi:hypothetical protein